MTTPPPIAGRLPPDAPPPAPAEAAPFDVVVTDLDRTFSTVDLTLDREALATARRLRSAGVVVVLATGRRVQDLAAWPALHDAFDGFVVECGAVWGTWGVWHATAAGDATAAVRSAARTLKAEGCTIDEGVASCSVPADWAERLDALPERPRLSVQPNRDRLDVVPAGVDKAAGLRLLLAHLSRPGRPGAVALPRRPRILAIGDGENDLPVFRASTHAVAVANAAEIVRQAAHEVAPLAACEGFVWAVQRALARPAPRHDGQS